MKKLILLTYLAIIACGQLLGQTVMTTAISLGIADEIISVQLGESRKLNIYLPEGYSKADTTRYPVIYLLDGGVDEDFVHVVGLVQFDTQPWVNRMSKSIVVGIVNSDRKRDMTFPTSVRSEKEKYPTTGGSEKFIAFIEKELQPYIQEHYSTSKSKTLIGESLGGLLATEVLFKKPYLFDRYIIISPSLWWDNESLLKITAIQPINKTSIYVAVGKEGLTPSPEPHVMEVEANLLEEKIDGAHNKQVTVQFDYLPDEDHATIAHQALYNAFKKLYAGGK